MQVPRKQNSESAIVGKPAFDFRLTDQDGAQVQLFEVLKRGAVLLVFYPNDFTTVCTRQLCNYRDNMDQFLSKGVQVIGVSANSPESHRRFADQYRFNFSLLSDPKHLVADQYDCRSYLMLGRVSRAVLIINRNRFVLYRYVEPTTFTHRKADELLRVVQDLSEHKLL